MSNHEIEDLIDRNESLDREIHPAVTMTRIALESIAQGLKQLRIAESFASKAELPEDLPEGNIWERQLSDVYIVVDEVGTAISQSADSFDRFGIKLS